MAVSHDDKTILRDLGKQIAEIAALPVHKEKADLWRRLNGLEKVRPLVLINETPWPEMDVDGELALGCSDSWCRQVERGLRRTLYQWRHMPADMVVEPRLWCPLVIHDTGFGLEEEADVASVECAGAITSRHFRPQITKPEDIEKIKMPEVTHDAEASERRYQQMCEIFDGIIPVKQRGIAGCWFTPWDELVVWWGVQEALTDLALRPEMVHAAMRRLVDAHLQRLNQWEEQNLLALNNGNVGAGSGGFGYTDELPQPDFDPKHVRPIDLWGSATPQIFSEVSPEMHWEFALKHEMRWLERFGLTYYGCCEPLHLKMGILRKIPNLRKVSMSPMADKAKGAEEIGADYVFSLKPNPAVLAWDKWNPDEARKNLREDLDKARGCVVEVIMKDISTVRHEPQRLWEWCEIAMQEAENFA